MKIRILLLICLSLLLNSCDCVFRLSGIVVDQTTKQPILNVEIAKTADHDLKNDSQSKTYTNEKGEYDYFDIAGRCNKQMLSFTKKGYETLNVELKNNAVDTIFLQAIEKRKPLRFIPREDFALETIQSASDYPSSYKDTAICQAWNLSPAEVKTILQNAEAISGREWHYLFGHYPCQIHGKLQQGAHQFEYSINSGAWLSISSVDTNMLYGIFKAEFNQFFLDSAWTED